MILIALEGKVLSSKGGKLTIEIGDDVISIPGAVEVEQAGELDDSPPAMTTEPVAHDFFSPKEEVMQQIADKINGGSQLSPEERRLVVKSPWAILMEHRDKFSKESRAAIAAAKASYIDSQEDGASGRDPTLWEFVNGMSLTPEEARAADAGGFSTSRGFGSAPGDKPQPKSKVKAI